MRAKRGFLSTIIAVTVSLFLLLTSAYVMSLSVNTVREEAWTTSNLQRSLYPIAWSTVNFVAQSLLDFRDGVGEGQLDKGENFGVFVGNVSTIFDPILSEIEFNIQNVASCRITLTGNLNDGIRISAEASKDGHTATANALLFDRATIEENGDWEIVWR